MFDRPLNLQFKIITLLISVKLWNYGSAKMSILLHPPHPYILSLVQFVESNILLLDCEFQLTTYILLSPKHCTVDVLAIIRMLWRNYVWHEGTVPAFSPLIKKKKSQVTLPFGHMIGLCLPPWITTVYNLLGNTPGLLQQVFSLLVGGRPTEGFKAERQALIINCSMTEILTLSTMYKQHFTIHWSSSRAHNFSAPSALKART